MVRLFFSAALLSPADIPIFQADDLNMQFTSIYAQQEFANYTVSGNPAGIVKNAGNFSYLRVFGAGHEVPAYNYTGLAVGQAALQIFEQAMRGDQLTST